MSGVDDNESISSSQSQVRRSTRIKAPSVDVQPLTPSKPKRVGRPRKTSTPTIEIEASMEVSDLPKTPSRKTTRRSPIVNENALNKTSAEVSDLPKTPSRKTTRRSSLVNEIDLPKTPSRRTTRRSSFVDENVVNKTPTKSLSLTQTETVKTPGRRNTRRSSLAEEPPMVVTPTKGNPKNTKEETNDEVESNTISRGRRILTPSNSMIVEETERNEDKVLSPRRTILKKAIVQIKKCDFTAAGETESESTVQSTQSNSKFLGTSLEPVEEERQEIESEKSHDETEDHKGNENDNVDPLNGISFVAFKPSMYSNEKKSPVRYPKTPSALLSKSSPRLLKQDEVEGDMPKRKSLSFEEVTHNAASVTDQSSESTASASLKEIEQEDVEMTDASIVAGSSTTSQEEERITIETPSEELVSSFNPEKLTEVGLPPTRDVDSLDDKATTVTVQSDCHVDELAGGDLIQLDGQKPDNTTDTIRQSTLTQCEKEKLNFAEESSLDGFLMQLDTDSIALTNADKKKEESGNGQSSLEDTLVLTEGDKVCTNSPLSQNEKSKNDVTIVLSDADVTPIKLSKLETSVDTTKNKAGQDQVESNQEPGKATETDESLLSFLEEESDTENLSSSRSSIKLSRLLQRMHNGGEKVEFVSVENVTLKSESFCEDEYKLSVTQDMEENAKETSGVKLNENKTDKPQMLLTEAVMSQENILEPNSLITKEAPKLNISAVEKNQCFEAGHEKESFTASKEDSNEVDHDSMIASLTTTNTQVIHDVSIKEVNVAHSNKTDQGRQNSNEDIEQLTSKEKPWTGAETQKLVDISVEENTAIRTTSLVEASRTVISETSKAEQMCLESENIVEEPLNSDKMDTLTEQQECDGFISFEESECILKAAEVLHSGHNETDGVAEQIENSSAVDESMKTLANNVSSCTKVNLSPKPLAENIEQAGVEAEVYDDSSVTKTLSESGRDGTVGKPELLENSMSNDTPTNNVPSCTEVNSSSTNALVNLNVLENVEQAVMEAELYEDFSVNKTLEQVSQSVDKPELLENSSAVNVTRDTLTNNISSCTELNLSSTTVQLDSNLPENVEQAGMEAAVYEDSSVNKTLEQVSQSVDKPELLENSSAVNVTMDTLTNNVSSCIEVNSSSTTVQLETNLQEKVEQPGMEAAVYEDSSVNKTLEQVSQSVDKPELLENSSAVNVTMDTLTNYVSSCMEVNSSSTTVQLETNLQEKVEQPGMEAAVYEDSSVNKTLEQVSQSVDKPELLENSSAVNVTMDTLTNYVSSCMEVNSSSTTVQLETNLQEKVEQPGMEAAVYEDSSVNKTLEQVSQSVDKPELLENSSAVNVTMDTLTNNVSSCMEVNSSSTTVQLETNLQEKVEQAGMEAAVYEDSSVNKTLENVSESGRNETVDKPELLENSSTTTMNVSMEIPANNVSSCTEVNSSSTTVQLDSNLVENFVEADSSMNKTLEHETTLEALNASLDVEVKEMIDDSCVESTEFCEETVSNELTHENISLVDTGANEIETAPQTTPTETIEGETKLENSETEVVENLERSVLPCDTELENKSIQNQTEPEEQDLEHSVVVTEKSKSEENSVQESDASEDQPECSYPIPEEIILVSQETKFISVSHKEAEELLVQQKDSQNEKLSETANDFELHVSSDSCTVGSPKQPEVSCPLSPNPTLGVEVEIQEEKIQEDIESESNNEAVLEQAAAANEIQEEINDLTSNNCRNDIIKKDSSIISIESHDESDNNGNDHEKCEFVSSEKRNEIPEHVEDLGSEDTECEEDEEGEEENVNDSFIVSDDEEENISVASEQEYVSFEDTNAAHPLMSIDEACENVNLPENRTDEQPNNKQNSEEVVENEIDKPEDTLVTVDNCNEKSNDSSLTTSNTDKTNHVDNKDVTETEDVLEPVQSSNMPSSRKTNSNKEADKRTPNKLQFEIEVEVSNEILQRSIQIDAIGTEIGIYFEKAGGTNKGRISIGKSPQKSETLEKINNKTNEESKEVATIGNSNKKLEEESIPKISLLENELGVSSSQRLKKSETKKHKTERTKKHAVETLDKSERKSDVQKSKADSEQIIKNDSTKNTKQVKKDSGKPNKRKASDLESSTSSIEKRMKLLPTVTTCNIEKSSKVISEKDPSKSKEISKSKQVIATEKSVEQPKVTATKDNKQKLKPKSEEKLNEREKTEKQYKHLRNIACSVKDVSEIVGDNSELTLPNQTIKINQLETKSSRKIVSGPSLKEQDLKNKAKKQKVVEKNRPLPSNTNMTENVTANVNSDNVQTKQKKVKNIALQEDVDHPYEHNKENNGKVATPSGIFKEEMLTPKKVRHAPGFIVTDKTPKAVGFTVKSLVKEKGNNRIGWKIENVQRSLHDIVEPPETPSGFKFSSIAKPSKIANKPNQRYILETELSSSAKRGRKRKNTNDASCYTPIKIKIIR